MSTGGGPWSAPTSTPSCVCAREAFEGANRSRGYRYVTHELRASDDPVVASEKIARGIMREEGLTVAYSKKKAWYSSCKGEISDAPENLVSRGFRADAPNEPWLADITGFGLPGGKVCLSPILDCFDGGLPAWSIGSSPNAELATAARRRRAGPSRRASGPRPTRTAAATAVDPGG